jgi:predicted nucleic acid-binding protein
MTKPKLRKQSKNSLPKPNKYNATKTTYKGYTYMSGKEARYAMWLDSEKHAGRVVDYKRQFKLSLDLNGIHIANYYADFLIEWENGVKEIVDVKGVVTDLFRQKQLLFSRCL